jgi:hypothetical protein
LQLAFTDNFFLFVDAHQFESCSEETGIFKVELVWRRKAAAKEEEEEICLLLPRSGSGQQPATLPLSKRPRLRRRQKMASPTLFKVSENGQQMLLHQSLLLQSGYRMWQRSYVVAFKLRAFINKTGTTHLILDLKWAKGFQDRTIHTYVPSANTGKQYVYVQGRI